MRMIMQIIWIWCIKADWLEKNSLGIVTHKGEIIPDMYVVSVCEVVIIDADLIID